MLLHVVISADITKDLIAKFPSQRAFRDILTARMWYAPVPPTLAGAAHLLLSHRAWCVLDDSLPSRAAFPVLMLERIHRGHDSTSPDPSSLSQPQKTPFSEPTSTPDFQPPGRFQSGSDPTSSLPTNVTILDASPVFSEIRLLVSSKGREAGRREEARQRPSRVSQRGVCIRKEGSRSRLAESMLLLLVLLKGGSGSRPAECRSMIA